MGKTAIQLGAHLRMVLFVLVVLVLALHLAEMIPGVPNLAPIQGGLVVIAVFVLVYLAAT